MATTSTKSIREGFARTNERKIEDRKRNGHVAALGSLPSGELADVATVSVAAGTVGVAIGAYLFFTAKPPSTTKTAVVPYFAGTSGGVTGRF